ncbi:hypothetical protein GCM10020369_07090 [Cryptosporangium minutisporangium]|uniref:Uncharacterized protein n=2 Tax=Cryptosporangium minutisporangium TaxID=113569 RepID=A0ABP6SQM8_9ACTN
MHVVAEAAQLVQRVQAGEPGTDHHDVVVIACLCHFHIVYNERRRITRFAHCSVSGTGTSMGESMEHTERLDVVRLAAKYHEALGRIETAGQLSAVLRLGRELSATLPAEQAALFGRLVAERRSAGAVLPRPRSPRDDTGA